MVAKVVQAQSQEGENSYHDAGFGAASSTSVGSFTTTPCYDQPLSPPTPLGTALEYPEPQDTTGQARRMATAGLSTRMGPQVLCKVISVSAPISCSKLRTNSLTIPPPPPPLPSTLPLCCQLWPQVPALMTSW